jgi:hypothetical protein
MTDWKAYADRLTASSIELTGDDSVSMLASNNCISLQEAPDNEFWERYCSSLHGLMVDRGYEEGTNGFYKSA